MESNNIFKTLGEEDLSEIEVFVRKNMTNGKIESVYAISCIMPFIGILVSLLEIYWLKEKDLAMMLMLGTSIVIILIGRVCSMYSKRLLPYKRNTAIIICELYMFSTFVSGVILVNLHSLHEYNSILPIALMSVLLLLASTVISIYIYKDRIRTKYYSEGGDKPSKNAWLGAPAFSAGMVVIFLKSVFPIDAQAYIAVIIVSPMVYFVVRCCMRLYYMKRYNIPRDEERSDSSSES